jgi:branched-chain amino acid transport system permease protein
MNATGVDLRKVWVPALLLIILLLLVALPYARPGYTVVLVYTILMYIILTMSWVLFSGPTGYLSLAPAAFFGVGIYTSALLVMKLPLPVVIAVGGLASACLALLVGALTLRLKGIYFAIFTFGLVELMKYFVLWFELKFSGTRGRFLLPTDNETIYYVLLAILVALLLTTYLVRRSKYGLALHGIGEDEEAAAHTGVNVTLLKVITFAISAIFIGAAGAIWAIRLTYIDPYIAFDINNSFMPVLMAIFGGMGQLYGPVLGATVFSYLREILITKFPYHYMLLIGIILLLAILYLPDRSQWSRQDHAVQSDLRGSGSQSRDHQIQGPAGQWLEAKQDLQDGDSENLPIGQSLPQSAGLGECVVGIAIRGIRQVVIGGRCRGGGRADRVCRFVGSEGDSSQRPDPGKPEASRSGQGVGHQARTAAA